MMEDEKKNGSPWGYTGEVPEGNTEKPASGADESPPEDFHIHISTIPIGVAAFSFQTATAAMSGAYLSLGLVIDDIKKARKGLPEDTDPLHLAKLDAIIEAREADHTKLREWAQGVNYLSRHFEAMVLNGGDD